jgi:hypothetical protein
MPQAMVDYLSKLPKSLPDDGRVLVHNRVTPTRKLGSRGFRAWLAAPDEKWVACDCGWAPELGQHYAVSVRAEA